MPLTIGLQFIRLCSSSRRVSVSRRFSPAVFKPHRKDAADSERKCADTIRTVLVPMDWPFPVLKYLYIFFRIKYTEAILSNSTRQLLWFEISIMLIAV